MDALEEESFALPFSSASDAEFDAVVGYLEDIIMEKYIEEQLLERIPGFNMAAFTATLQHHKDEMAGDIFDMLLTFTDFLAFKEMFLEYRAEKEGRGLDLSSGLVVTSLCKPSSVPASHNNLQH
ncbi:ADP ribosylation factor like GTPase 2 binding protein [Rhinolophus ferrumequinum]|uniref:ADP-ribosylation factor-like protein 2-binding protein n=1 Tax=Rhinolophus ferrumequinum TaxID=59479 RepID=A0A671G064_RHIFE|nr:ADP ribosylation factor like GTPase 2 binding protein [Rhinolophus ferrumequinum]